MAQHAVPIKATFDASGRRLAGRPRFGSLRQRAPPVCPTTKIISLVTQDRLDVINGKVTSDYVILFFSSEDIVYAKYGDLPAGYDPATNAASFRGPLRPQPTRFP
jgi:hypothetical protein